MQRAQRGSPEDETTCPVSDDVLARLYRGSAADVDTIVSELSEPTRARLAVFCYSRAHLREIGRQTAALCSPQILLRVAGPALGACLVELKPEYFPHRANVRTSAKVTLPMAKDMLPVPHDVDDESFERI
jgi:hypothetical protein